MGLAYVLDKYILLDVLLCSIAEYFYESFTREFYERVLRVVRILASP